MNSEDAEYSDFWLAQVSRVEMKLFANVPFEIDRVWFEFDIVTKNIRGKEIYYLFSVVHLDKEKNRHKKI